MPIYFWNSTDWDMYRNHIYPLWTPEIKGTVQESCISCQAEKAFKNRIRAQSYRLGIDFRNFNRKTDNDLRSASAVLNVLVNDLESLNREIREIDRIIEETVKTSPSASLLYTIPGIGYYGALAIASEIGNISRFPCEDNIFSYAGLVPGILQSGNSE